MKRRKTDPGKKRSRIGPRARGILAGAALAAGVLAAGGFWTFRYAERRIAPLLDGDWTGDYTTRIYASPFLIRPRDRLSPWELRSRLARLGYEAAAEGVAPDREYTEDDGSFELSLRPFEHPFVKATPSRVRIAIESGRVTSIRLAGNGVPLLEAALEPELLYEISGKRRIQRTPLRASDIPRTMFQALIAVEDRRFYEHPGVDLRGIARAAWRNVRARRITEGGSTLTQQLAKNLFLNPRRTFTRKFQEALCALYLEARFTKHEIVRIYLDSVYFGQNGPVSVIGLAAASRHFFNKKPIDLTVAECALLAGLLRSPRRYNPFLHPEAAVGRRNAVLAAMEREGFLSPGTHALASAEPLDTTRVGQAEARESDYFLGYIERVLEERYEDEAWLTRGMTVFTTLDSWAQERARQAVSSSRHQAALVALDPRSGAIRALVGGKDYAASPFDRAAVARRQPGSAFKPFVYGAALRSRNEQNIPWTAATLLDDATRSYQIEGGTWTPRNYALKYRGPVPLRDALALSLNAATVDLASDLGPRRVIKYARALGVTSPLRPELGLALGIFEVTLLELTGAYCAFANGGLRVQPYGVSAAVDSEGEVLEFHSPEPFPVLDPAEAYLMTDLLREVVRSGTARSLPRYGIANAAGKTGTTNDGKDAWFIGYTPDIAAGVWTGSDIPKKLGLTGSGYALPIWARFIQAVTPPADDGLPSEEAWPKPDGVQALRIDPASGLRAVAGCPQKRTELFLPGTAPVYDCPLHAGGVLGWFKRFFRKPPPEDLR